MDSVQNSKAIGAWKRQPDIVNLEGQRDKIQKQLDKILASPYTESAEKQANTLYSEIAALNKKIGTKKSKAKKSTQD